MRPGDILSRIFDKPLAIMSTSSYRAERARAGPPGHRALHHHAQGRDRRRVLLVDDLADSGHTLHA
jgi:hypoxanthine phosphoribosyltransferase